MTDESDPLTRANPVTPEALRSVPLHDARAELREQIMGSPASDGGTRRGRRWLTPVAAAAAVVLIAGAAWLATTANGGDDSTPAATDPSTATSEASPSAKATPTGPKERYQMPPHPVLITAQRWEPDVVEGDEVTWAGPKGATVSVGYFIYGQNEDPFSVDNDQLARGTSLTVLGEVTRLTSVKPDKATKKSPDHVAITSPVIDVDGTAVVFKGTGLSKKAFTDVIESAQAVNLRQYDSVVKPAVG